LPEIVELRTVAALFVRVWIRARIVGSCWHCSSLAGDNVVVDEYGAEGAATPVLLVPVTPV